MRYHSYLNTAQKIIAAYKGAAPLPDFLKRFFAADKKFGSKDRKQIAALCYNYYRLGKALAGVPVEERIITSTFLCGEKDNAFLAALKPEWNEKVSLGIKEKLSFIPYPLAIEEIFPWTSELSATIDAAKFCAAFLQQPDLFVRVRPGKRNAVEAKLIAAGIAYSAQDDCIALPNATKIDDIITLNKEAVIQDKNSQKVLDYLATSMVYPKIAVVAWDCCAASGGKSILLHDILQGKLQLAVSDIRESILFNLKKRFAAAGIRNYRSFIADLTSGSAGLPIDPNIIICDAPCTGSGTWGRTPEQLFYFEKEQVAVYAQRQRQIISNIIPWLQKDGLLVYITCSVFKQENEEIAAYIQHEFQLQLLHLQVLNGYTQKADNMFVAIFRNSQQE